MPSPTALPRAILSAADRLISTLMTLVDAVGEVALAGSIPTFPAPRAQLLALRLVALVTALIRISAFGIRAPANATTAARIHPAPAPRSAAPTESLPRHRGWLLAALPDCAPAIAAALRSLLADPALVALLHAAPTVHRTLRPLLRGLDLAITEPPPPPRTPPPRIKSRPPPPAARPGPITPSRPRPPLASRPAKIANSHRRPSHALFITI